MVKKFEFKGPRLRGTPSIFVPLNCFKFYRSFIFTYLKILCVQLQRLKSLNFAGPCLGKTPILEPLILLDLVDL